MDVWRLFDSIDKQITGWMARNGIMLLRVALGIVFFWFGILKFFPGMSEVEGLAGRTIGIISFGYVPPSISLPILAAWECAIGLGFIFGIFLRLTLVLLLFQMMGAFLPIVLFPAETWKYFPYAPSLEGQYIFKNLVLLGAAVVVGSTVRGGRIKPDPSKERTDEGKTDV